MAILTLFFCSGATALVYEVLWSKYLALLFGSTVQAQTVVLAVFMGGLALGNKIFSRTADRALHPLRIYGTIEIVIGLYAALFSFLYTTADTIFSRLGAYLLDHLGWLLALKGLLSIVLLLGPTILMGGTLPVLAAWLQKHTADAGRRSARFYAVNSFGAVFGAGMTGFLLVEWLGLRRTMDYSALVNLIIGFSAIVLDGKLNTPEAAVAPANESRTVPVKVQTGDGFFRWACILVALTGAVSMGLEVLASRCLCLIFGASLQVFSVVLIAFILGISLGSTVVSSPAFKNLRAEAAALLLAITAAVVIGLLVYNIENVVDLYLTAQSGLNRNLMGYRYYRFLDVALSICVIGVPAAALGAVLPLCIRAASETTDFLGDRVGRLLTWNTLGAVVGSLLTGFVLMPVIGLRSSFAALGALLIIVSIVVAIALRRSIVIATGTLAGIFLIVATMSGDEGWRDIFSAGIFRVNNPDPNVASLLKERRGMAKLVFYEDAADATVSVEQIKGAIDLSLRIDGKVEASANGDSTTQKLVTYVPLVSKPDSKEVFCFGMGSGITAGAVLNCPVEHLTVAENCGPVLRAAKLFDRWNNGVLTNSRTRIYREDARTVLKLSTNQYDVIIAQPSNPWMVGIASVFTREFYDIAANHLKSGGLMAQWFHTYEMNDQNVDLVLRTFGKSFPQMEIWDIGPGDILLLGSDRPWSSGVQVYSNAFKSKLIQNDLKSVGIATPESLLARRMASQLTAFAIPDLGPLQSDDTPVLEYDATRAFYIHHHNRGVFRLQRFDERTWQMDLASDEANDSLAKLDPPTLQTIFAYIHGSANDDLFLYLRSLYAQFCGQGAARPLIADNRAMPCSLEGPSQNYPIYTPPSAVTNSIVNQLVMAEYSLRSDPAKGPAIENIKQALSSVAPVDLLGADWSPAYYADLGIKASLKNADRSSAKAILLQGLRLVPDSDQLLYLSRILLRQGIVQSSDLVQLEIKSPHEVRHSGS